MVNAHVAHDCRVGSEVIMANNVMLAGHVTVGDRAYLSGAAAVHQYCRIGELAMVGGQAHITKDVPPYVTIDGLSSLIVGLNVVGLRRAGFDTETLAELKAAYRLAFRSGLRWDEMLQQLSAAHASGPSAEFYRFMSATKRGCVPERALPRRATLRLHQPHIDAASEEPPEARVTA
jgi:UDP-N-acetylglucosamine acyltransferase